MAVNTNFGLRISCNETKSLDGGVGKVKSPIKFGPTGLVGTLIDQAIASGTANGESDTVWWDKRSVTGSENLDLAGGLTSQATGDAAAFAEATLIAVYNHDTSTNLVVGGASSAGLSTVWLAATQANVLRPQGGILLWAPEGGIGVTAGSADILRIAPASGTIAYDILIVGRSA